MNNRKNAYTEVYTILQELDEEEYNKIPSEIIEAIRTNMNEEYDSPFYYDNLPMLPAKQKATIEKYLTIYNSTREITISYNQNNSDTAQAITLEVPR